LCWPSFHEPEIFRSLLGRQAGNHPGAKSE
jgi:hypothetical protein